jgi:hypothetical protein
MDKLFGVELQNKLDSMDYKEALKYQLELCENCSDKTLILSITKKTAIQILKDLGEI